MLKLVLETQGKMLIMK